MNATTKRQVSAFNRMSSRPETGETQDVWDNLVSQAVRKKIVNRMPMQVRGHYIYFIRSGWEAKVLRQDEDIRKVETLSELSEAMADESVKTIMILRSSIITRELISGVCERNTQAKTIFFERGQNE